jgi:hypothetical protein
MTGLDGVVMNDDVLSFVAELMSDMHGFLNV